MIDSLPTPDWTDGDGATVLSWSGGKDSTATAILAKEIGFRFDAIAHVAPDPFAMESVFLRRFEEFMEQPVTIVRGPTFEDLFFRRKKNGPNQGQIYGWPFTMRGACADALKVRPLRQWAQSIGPHRFVLGIAADETHRLKRIVAPNLSLLYDNAITTAAAREMCEQHGLLNPLYQFFDRLGCVRCPKQPLSALRMVRDLEPEKWAWMLSHDKDSPVPFGPRLQLQDVEARFAWEDRDAETPDLLDFMGAPLDA